MGRNAATTAKETEKPGRIDQVEIAGHGVAATPDRAAFTPECQKAGLGGSDALTANPPHRRRTHPFSRSCSRCRRPTKTSASRCSMCRLLRPPPPLPQAPPERQARAVGLYRGRLQPSVLVMQLLVFKERRIFLSNCSILFHDGAQSCSNIIRRVAKAGAVSAVPARNAAIAILCMICPTAILVVGIVFLDGRELNELLIALKCHLAGRSRIVEYRGESATFCSHRWQYWCPQLNNLNRLVDVVNGLNSIAPKPDTCGCRPSGSISPNFRPCDFSTLSNTAQNRDKTDAGITRSQAGADLCHRSTLLVLSNLRPFILKHVRLKRLSLRRSAPRKCTSAQTIDQKYTGYRHGTIAVSGVEQRRLAVFRLGRVVVPLGCAIRSGSSSRAGKDWGHA